MRRLVLVLLLALAWGSVAQADTVYVPVVLIPAPVVQWARVTHVADGDTIDVTLECCECISTFRVRLLAIDTPERGQCYYAEAKAALTVMVDGQRVGLERDRSERGSFGRLLRHLYTEGGVWVNGDLIARGFARVKIFLPDDKYEGALLALQDGARMRGDGAWGDCAW